MDGIEQLRPIDRLFYLFNLHPNFVPITLIASELYHSSLPFLSYPAVTISTDFLHFPTKSGFDQEGTRSNKLIDSPLCPQRTMIFFFKEMLKCVRLSRGKRGACHSHGGFINSLSFHNTWNLN